MKTVSSSDNKVLKKVALISVAFLILMSAIFFFPQEAFAVNVGGQEIEGYKPSDMIQSDINIDASDPSAIAPRLEQLLVVFVKILLPILMVACVALIIYNAVRNIFLPPEKKTKIGKLVKEMFMGFFWILFSWVIVEVIVFLVTNGETLIYGMLFG